jgi:NTE family protein
MSTTERPRRPRDYDKTVGLVLQGGGALGSYQAGVYEVLAESEYLPDWVAGISIGAINAALIAGNPPHRRVERLKEFWEGVTAVHGFAPKDRRWSALSALLLGQSGFFHPRSPTEWWFGPAPVSYYSTSPLKTTLERLVDFDRINGGDMHFSVGAVNVRTGNFAYFDNRQLRITPEHVMASAALPPGFPAIEIDGQHYWDGGLVSNTPLQYVLEYIPRRSRLIFQVDLFHARGALPEDLEAVNEREKDIRYSSRTRTVTDVYRQIHDVRHNINLLWDRLPQDLRNTAEGRFLYEFGCVTTMDIVQLIYRPDETEGNAKDYEFSRTTMEARWAAGRDDATRTLDQSPWLAPMPRGAGARTFDVRASRQDAGGPSSP